MYKIRKALQHSDQDNKNGLQAAAAEEDAIHADTNLFGKL